MAEMGGVQVDRAPTGQVQPCIPGPIGPELATLIVMGTVVLDREPTLRPGEIEPRDELAVRTENDVLGNRPWQASQDHGCAEH